jgi:pyruvate dehydrogenase complex dehydrogenase (E1) component
VTLAALKTLADQQKLSVETVVKARDSLGIDPDKFNPRLA